jgi:uncharacterized membrane protein
MENCRRRKVVGDWSDTGTLRSSSLHGYVSKNGQFTSLDDPGVTGTAAREINNANQVVGISLDKKLNDHGFILMGGVYQKFNFPGSSLTDGNGINDQGMIVAATSTATASNTATRHGFSRTLRSTDVWVRCLHVLRHGGLSIHPKTALRRE